MSPHPLANYEIQKYYQNEPRFNGVYSGDNLPKIRDGAYVINLDEYSDIGTHRIAFTYKIMMLLILIVLEYNIFQKKLKHLVVIETFIFRKEAHDIIMCRHFCILFNNFMLAGKTLTDFTNLFSPDNFKKKDIILNYFMTNV